MTSRKGKNRNRKQKSALPLMDSGTQATTLPPQNCERPPPVSKKASQNVLADLPSELQYHIYKQVFLDALKLQTTVPVVTTRSNWIEARPNWSDAPTYFGAQRKIIYLSPKLPSYATNSAPKSGKNITALLRVSKCVHVEAAKAFCDFWPREIKIWRTATRKAISRSIRRGRILHYPTGEDASLKSILSHRHISVRTDIEFEEDFLSLTYVHRLFQRGSRDYSISYDINLGYVSAHDAPVYRGWIFQKQKLGVMSTIACLNTIKAGTGNRNGYKVAKFNVAYRQGCNCGEMQRSAVLCDAMRWVDQACKLYGLACTVEMGSAWGMARWYPGWYDEHYLRLPIHKL